MQSLGFNPAIETPVLFDGQKFVLAAHQALKENDKEVSDTNNTPTIERTPSGGGNRLDGSTAEEHNPPVVGS